MIPNNYNYETLSSNQQTVARLFINKVYAWMAGGLLITALVALWAASTPAIASWVMSSRFGMIGMIIAEFALVMYIVARLNTLSVQTAGLLFLVYATLNGITLSTIFFVYTEASIASTFGIAALTFAVMSLYGYTTKSDLTKWGNILFMALIGLILASVVNIFLQSAALHYIASYVGVLIFTGLVAYDTQKIKRMATVMEGEEVAQKSAILGALTLYLDFINLFLYLLRIFGNRR